jgi:RNA polymerase sigma-70 factor (ECF subfamily)
MQDADAALIDRAKRGDTDAFRLLLERHSRNVFALAFRMTGNEFDAEDVVQETFLRAFRQLENYESRASFGTWVYRIASNYALDLIRSRRRHESRVGALAEEDTRGLLDSVASNDPQPDRLLYGAQVRVRIQGALAELSDQERTAFLMRHFHGMSIDEIGAVLGTATSATKNSIFRAVRKLRDALEPVVSSNHAAHHG